MASPSPNSQQIPNGNLDPSSTWGDVNNITFLVQQTLARMQTATLVRIEKCSNTGGIAPVGYVDVTPLVNQIDGADNPTPHVTIYNLPYLRMQGGSDAVIMDPKVGDIGCAVFASRDISKVKSTKKQGNPGSRRQYNFADGMYLGGMLNGTPTQYIQFSAAGIEIHSPTAIVVNAPTVTINAAVTLNGTLSQTGGGTASFSGDVTAQGTSLHTHAHGGVQPGSGQTGVPV